MAWFNNMTLKGKLLAGFITVAIIAGVIGGVGIFYVKKIDEADTKLYLTMTVPLGELGHIATDFQRMRVNSRDLINAPADKRQHFIDRLKDLNGSIDKYAESYEKTLFSVEGKKMFADFVAAKKTYNSHLDKMTQLVLDGKTEEATAILQGEAAKSSRELQSPSRPWLPRRSVSPSRPPSKTPATPIRPRSSSPLWRSSASSSPSPSA
jgi:methyl-accepting chemotaxis protein